MSCKPVILGQCGDTSLGAGGASNAGRIFPDDANSEVGLWDSIAQEPARLSGTPVRLHSVRRAKNLHPLYREPSADGHEWEFSGPWEVMAAMDFNMGQDIDSEASEHGLQKIYSAVMYISRKELEDVGAPVPKIGDVIDFWDRAPFGADYVYWDVVKANPDGNMFTSEVYTMYRLELKVRSRFEPGRKVLGTNV